MTRDAKLFYLKDLDYTPIKEKIEFDQAANYLTQEIAIFTYHNFANYFIILSVSDKVDKIVLENGGIQATSNDLYKFALKERKSTLGELVFGEENLIDYLPIVK